MLAQTFSNALERRGIHYGWVIAAVTFLAMLTTSAALGLPGAMLQPLSKEFGWSTDQLSSVFAVRFALFGLLGPFAAVFITRFGLRKVMVTAAAFIALSLLLATRVTELWQMFLLWGVLLGCGTGLTALVLGAIVASRWFTARRGLVVGVLAASTATGQLIFLPVAAWLIEHVGWRYAVLPVFAACLVVSVLVLLFMQDSPKIIGLRSFGEPEGALRRRPVPPCRRPSGHRSRVLAEASRNRTFWILAGTFFICGLSTNGLVQTHFISLCGDNGLGIVPAASVLSMMGAVRPRRHDALGLPLRPLTTTASCCSGTTACAACRCSGCRISTFTLYGLSIFALFYGLDWIATVPPTVKLAAQAFGKERAGLVFGWVFAAHQLGAAVAAYGAGLTRTLLLTYNPALFTAGAACLVAAAAVLAIRRPNRAGAVAVAVAPA